MKVEGARGQQAPRATPARKRHFRRHLRLTARDEPQQEELRQLADVQRDRIGHGVVVIGSTNDGRVSIVVAVTKDLTGKVHAGNIVKTLAPIVGGRGGGRPDLPKQGTDAAHSGSAAEGGGWSRCF